jgi:hypothetical protein
MPPAGLDMAGGFRNMRERLAQPPDEFRMMAILVSRAQAY